jgi:hypothetical protein
MDLFDLQDWLINSKIGYFSQILADSGHRYSQRKKSGIIYYLHIQLPNLQNGFHETISEFWKTEQ